MGALCEMFDIPIPPPHPPIVAHSNWFNMSEKHCRLAGVESLLANDRYNQKDIGKSSERKRNSLGENKDI